MDKLEITIVIDNPNSWMNSYVPRIKETLGSFGKIRFVNRHENILDGDIAIFLSCEQKISDETMKKNQHNLVVHESDLPSGKGWSPVTWQVLEGKNKIPICLFEATEKIDSGQIYEKEHIELVGNELIDEIREKQMLKTLELIVKFLKGYPNVRGIEQKGKETFYRKRNSADSEISPEAPIKDQFNILQIVDNDRYPAFFYYKGKKYILKIYRGD